jgi:predicted nuclease of restriction endonuclease-like RecB superfamily
MSEINEKINTIKHGLNKFVKGLNRLYSRSSVVRSIKNRKVQIFLN